MDKTTFWPLFLFFCYPAEMCGCASAHWYYLWKKDNSKFLHFCFQCVDSVSGGDSSLKRVAVVEDFFDIIYAMHVEISADPGKAPKHAGQKKTYKAVSILEWLCVENTKKSSLIMSFDSKYLILLMVSLICLNSFTLTLLSFSSFFLFSPLCFLLFLIRLSHTILPPLV